MPPPAPESDAPAPDPSGESRTPGKSGPKPNLDTPAMRQFTAFKEQHPGCVLFFRMGDFYEMFLDDAVLANKVMGVTLTQRSPGVPMAGVPHHAVEGYLRRMIQAGHRVAVCDQVEDPAHAKGIVKRAVTRVITPGTLTDETLLNDEDVNPLCAAAPASGGRIALAWAELSTGSFSVVVLPPDQAAEELARIGPSELCYPDDKDGQQPVAIAALPLAGPRTARPGWSFRPADATEALQRQYAVADLAGFGFDAKHPDTPDLLSAAGGLLHYLLETQQSDNGRLTHLRPPRRFARAEHLVVDPTSLASLEIERTLSGSGGGGDTKGSVLATLRSAGGRAACVTAMGKRRLRDWLCYPLADRAAIEARQRVVQTLVDDPRFVDELGEALGGIHDVPRITARLAVGRALPRDLVGLGQSAAKAAALRDVLAERPPVRHLYERLDQLTTVLDDLADRVTTACVDQAPAHLREGGLFRDGHDEELDEYRGLQRDANTWLAKYQKQLIEQTGVPSLKVGYNKVFGYYIELTAAHRDKIRDDDPNFATWTRKQTLKNAERFITPDLKTFETRVLSAGGKAIDREQDLFADLCGHCAQEITHLQAFADVAADLDVLRGFACRAVRHRYVKPQLTDDNVLRATAARHPVLDELLGDQFVPNDIALGKAPGGIQPTATRTRPLWPCSPAPTWPAKAPTSAPPPCLALLAHTGSFVPAESAVVGVCDRLFTRVGAHDELHAGRSTFMVEMTETANICHHATERSLVILDEIGRGTSTLDGLSLAWAITEHLAAVGARTLFATHYHELTALADRFATVGNLSVTVREWNDEIVFLHRIRPGATDRSYGIHVAKLAGLPEPVVKRANELLEQLAVRHGNDAAAAKPAKKVAAPVEPMPLFAAAAENHPALAALRELDLNTLTPMAAFDALRKLVDDAKP